MDIGWRHALVGAAVLFLLFLVVKLRPAGFGRPGFAAEIRAAKQRAREAKTSEARAEALAEAGRLARASGRYALAAALFQRAMKTDPTSVDAVEHAAAALERRPRLLESLLWRRLAHVPWDAEHLAAARATVTALRRIYQRGLRDSAKAEFMRRFAERLG
jgi:tetratricopeptide (TPR) repeat protein